MKILLLLLSIVVVSSYGFECDRTTGVCKEIWGKSAGLVPNLKVQPNEMSPRYKISEFVKKLVPTLSLKEKIGQMTQLDITMLLDSNALASGQVVLNQTALQYGIQQYGIGSYLNSPFAGGPIGNKSVCDKPLFLLEKLFLIFLCIGIQFIRVGKFPHKYLHSSCIIQ